MREKPPIQGGLVAEISNGISNLWVLFGYYCYKKLREFTKIAFCVSCCKPHNKAIFRRILKTSKCEELVSIPVRVTISIAHIWLNKAVCELLFFARFWVWSLFGLYCDFFGLYAGRTVFSPPCVFFLSKDSASAIA